MGLMFETVEVEKDVRALLALTCPHRSCCGKPNAPIFKSKTELKRHISTSHQLALCDICLTHKKVFPSEFHLFPTSNSTALTKHHRDQHPTCRVCSTLFFSEDELAAHYRDRHERCHICWRQDAGSQPYFRDYASLEEHFRRDHYLCPERLCLDLKFVVFASELEYKAHMGELHLGHVKMQRAVQKQMTRIDPSFMLDSGRCSELPGRPGEQRERLAQQRLDAPQRTHSPALHHGLSHPQQSQQPSVPVNLAPVDASKLFFGAAVADLAGKLASLSLYQQRNEDLSRALSASEQMSKEAVMQLQTTCRRYQEGRMPVHEWIQRCWDQLGGERAKRLLPVIVELQLETGKRMEMERAFRAHAQRMEAFPPLPSSGPNNGQSSFHSASGSRIVPVGKTVRLVTTTFLTPHDPSKNPLGGPGSFGAGIGRPTSSSSKKKIIPNPVGFSQAAAAGTGNSTASTVTSSYVPAGPPVDEKQFPALPGTAPKAKAKGQTHQHVASSNAFARTADDDDGAFVVGEILDPNALAANAGGKKKNKRQVVMRFG